MNESRKLRMFSLYVGTHKLNKATNQTVLTYNFILTLVRQRATQS